MRRPLAYIPTLLVLIAIAWLSLMENPNLPLQNQCSDKFWHTLMYLGLAAVWSYGALRNAHDRLRHAAEIWSLSWLYGGLMELMQAYCTDTRSGDWGDLGADIAGATLGIAIVWLTYLLWKKKPSTTSH